MKKSGILANAIAITICCTLVVSIAYFFQKP